MIEEYQLYKAVDFGRDATVKQRLFLIRTLRPSPCISQVQTSADEHEQPHDVHEDMLAVTCSLPGDGVI